jgi:hypothetical protein
MRSFDTLKQVATWAQFFRVDTLHIVAILTLPIGRHWERKCFSKKWGLFETGVMYPHPEE